MPMLPHPSSTDSSIMFNQFQSLSFIFALASLRSRRCGDIQMTDVLQAPNELPQSIVGARRNSKEFQSAVTVQSAILLPKKTLALPSCL